MLATILEISTEKPLKNNIEREKDRYQSSVTEVEFPEGYLG